MLKGLLVIVGLLTFAPLARLIAAEEPHKMADAPAVEKPSGDAPKEKSKTSDPKDETFKTKHGVTVGGQRIEYTAVAGTIVLRDAEDKPTASVFYIAYTRNGVEDISKRPITFSFNGGPGSASIWLHLGLLGPRRVQLNEDGSAVPPPYK